MKNILILCLILVGQYIEAQTTKLDIDAYRVFYNPIYQKAYVAVVGGDLQYPNSILQIDPIAGTVEKQISLPEIPLIIHQTLDQKYLYISYQYQPDVLKIKLDDFTIVGNVNTNGFDVVDFAVLPNDNNALIVIRGYGEQPKNMVMYKDGILQPRQVSISYANTFSALSIKNDGSQLYAHNRISTGYEGQVANILDDGIEFTGRTWDYMIPSFGFIKNHNDLVYDENGNFLDPYTDSIPKLIAKIPIYKISDYSRTGFEYSALHGCYVFGHAINYKGYISFFHGEHYNYLGSFALDGQIEIIYDLAIVDHDHFILVGLRYSGENKCLLLFSGGSKDKMVLPQKPASDNNSVKQDHQWGIIPH